MIRSSDVNVWGRKLPEHQNASMNLVFMRLKAQVLCSSKNLMWEKTPKVNCLFWKVVQRMMLNFGEKRSKAQEPWCYTVQRVEQFS